MDKNKQQKNPNQPSKNQPQRSESTSWKAIESSAEKPKLDW